MAVYVIAIVSALLVSGVAVLVWVYLICRAVCFTLGGPPPPLTKLDYESAKQTIAYWSQNLPPFFAVNMWINHCCRHFFGVAGVERLARQPEDG